MLLEENQVFISYSHEDKEWLEKLKTMFKPLTRNKPISLWDDTKIKAGAKWKEEIKKALDSAKVAILIVSDNFLASDFIREHEFIPLLNAAEKKRLKIFWIYVSACCYEETEIEKYQPAHDISKPLDNLETSEAKQILKEIVKKIKDEIEESLKNNDLQYEQIGYEIPIFLLVWLKDNITLHSSYPLPTSLSLESEEEKISQSVKNYMYKMGDS